MPRASTLDRLRRLDLLESRLKSDDPLIVGALAREFGVSHRTLSRDIGLLRERGLPVDADRGRGGGIRLHNSWGIGRLNLTYREAVDLLVSLAVAEQAKSPILMANLGPIRRKLAASFSPANRHKIDRLKARLLIGEAASPVVLGGYVPPPAKVVENLHQAFLTMNAARIAYEDGKGARTVRAIEPHYLLLNYPVWYALAWDRTRDAIRTFRCDRMRGVETTEESFRLKPYADFRVALEGADVVLP